MGEWYPKERLGDLPAAAARRWGAREALVHEGKRWSYGAFDREVDRTAKGLIALGVEKGEHVALWMPNRAEWLFLAFAIAKIGAVLVPLNTRYRTDDVAYTVRQSDSATWIAVDRSGPVDYAAMLRAVLRGWRRRTRAPPTSPASPGCGAWSCSAAPRSPERSTGRRCWPAVRRCSTPRWPRGRAPSTRTTG